MTRTKPSSMKQLAACILRIERAPSAFRPALLSAWRKRVIFSPASRPKSTAIPTVPLTCGSAFQPFGRKAADTKLLRTAASHSTGSEGQDGRGRMFETRNNNIERLSREDFERFEKEAVALEPNTQRILSVAPSLMRSVATTSFIKCPACRGQAL